MQYKSLLGKRMFIISIGMSVSIVTFFVTTFKLDIPSSLDAAISFLFDSGSTETVQPYRALLFVNGWMMGKRDANLGCVVFIFPRFLDLSLTSVT